MYSHPADSEGVALARCYQLLRSLARRKAEAQELVVETQTQETSQCIGEVGDADPTRMEVLWPESAKTDALMSPDEEDAVTDCGQHRPRGADLASQSPEILNNV